jgi:hypothetical protein
MHLVQFRYNFHLGLAVLLTICNNMYAGLIQEVFIQCLDFAEEAQ